MKKSKLKPSLYDMSQPTQSVKLKFPFMWGAKRVDEIALRTASYASDMEELDDVVGEKARVTHLIALLSDVGQNGKGIPARVLSEKLRTIDFMRLNELAGYILASGDEPEEEKEGAEGGDPKESVEAIRAIGGTSRQ